MCENIIKLLDEAIQDKNILLDAYKTTNENLKVENALLKSENEQLLERIEQLEKIAEGNRHENI